MVEESWSAADPSGAPRDPQAAGCVVAFGGMVLLTAVPALGNFIDVEAGTAFGFLALAVLLLVAGAGLAIGGGRARARAERREIARVSALLDDPPSRGVALREAALLLARARGDAGPLTVGTLSPTVVARELGPSLGLVIQVEEHLVQSRGAPRVFTSDRFRRPGDA